MLPPTIARGTISWFLERPCEFFLSALNPPNPETSNFSIENLLGFSLSLSLERERLISGIIRDDVTERERFKTIIVTLKVCISNDERNSMNTVPVLIRAKKIHLTHSMTNAA